MALITSQSVIEALQGFKQEVQNGDRANVVTPEILGSLDGIEDGQEVFDALKDTYDLLTYDDIEEKYALKLSKDIAYEIQLKNLLVDVEDGIDDAGEGFSYTQLLQTLGYDNVDNLDGDGALLSQLVAAMNKSGQYNAIVGGFARIGALLQGLKNKVEEEG